MKPNIIVSPAEPEDAETLVEIMIDALESDLWPRLMWGVYRRDAVRKQREVFIPMMKERFSSQDPSWITKATDTETKSIIGFSSLVWVSISHNTQAFPVANANSASISNSEDLDFGKWFSRDSSARYKRLMGASDHVVLQSLYVLPDYQRQGIGIKLLKWPLMEYNLSEETIFVQALNSTAGFYERFGWEEKDATSADLSDWEGSDNGFGRWKAPQLLYNPQQAKWNLVEKK